MTSTDKRLLDGGDLQAMIGAALSLLERHAGDVDALNVFPVPDGDTGTNMLLTLQDVVKAGGDAPGQSAADVSSAMAKGALMGARGNSGVILSQFFKGIAQGFEDSPKFGAPELAWAMQQASEQARKAVGNPVEGTMLTVIRETAAACAKASSTGNGMSSLFDAMSGAARETVALTPTMLSVLRDAGVVDAGGYGFWLIVEGARLHLDGGDLESARVEVPAPIGAASGAGESVSSAFLETVEHEVYGYCTQFMVEGQGLDPDAVRENMISMAESVVVVGDQSLVKVHAHAVDPDPLIDYGRSLGSLSQVSSVNMDDQHRDYAEAHRRPGDGGRSQGEKTHVAVVAVALGQGLEAVFEELGASVLRTGDTMNPSVQELLDAIDAAPSQEVILLPNNKNVIPGANRAADLTSKAVEVVPSRTMPQGIAALLVFSPNDGLEGSASNMERALADVRTGEIGRALRSATLNGVSVEEGQVMGMLERDLVAAGDEVSDVLLAVLRKAEAAEGDLVTLYSGDSTSRQDAETAALHLENAFPGVEVQLVDGGQPHYYYTISIE